jgi:hypothetical protein
MWVSSFIYHLYVVKLDVQELIYRHQGSGNGEIVFEFNGNCLINKSLEKGIEKLQKS